MTDSLMELPRHVDGVPVSGSKHFQHSFTLTAGVAGVGGDGGEEEADDEASPCLAQL